MQSGQYDPLHPDLREAAETLEQALAEACEVESAHTADTGELIRIEEMLALASEAARRAISIRRKTREDAAAGLGAGTEVSGTGVSGARESGTAGEPGAEPEPGTLSAHRLFTDRRGVSWDVWAVYPEARPAQLSALPGSFQSGWLVFESGREKRRLSPIPSDWQTLTDSDLEQLCDRAAVAPPRRGRAPGSGLGEDASPGRT